VTPSVAHYSSQAAKTLARLDQTTRQRIDARVGELEANPYDPRLSKHLEGPFAGIRSSRVGDWRILYTVENQARTLYVIDVRPRGGAYR
jgi:mRNA interferase RelE/StbE